MGIICTLITAVDLNDMPIMMMLMMLIDDILGYKVFRIKRNIFSDTRIKLCFANVWTILFFLSRKKTVISFAFRVSAYEL